MPTILGRRFKVVKQRINFDFNDLEAFLAVIVLALPPDHPLTHKGALDWKDLGTAALIVPTKGTGNRLLIDEAMARARLTMSWTVEVERSTTALELVKAGIGVALLPQASVGSGINPAVVTRRIKSPVIARPIGFLTRHSQSDRNTVTALKAAIRRVGGSPSVP